MHADPSGLLAWAGLAGGYALVVGVLGRHGRTVDETPVLRLIHGSGGPASRARKTDDDGSPQAPSRGHG